MINFATTACVRAWEAAQKEKGKEKEKEKEKEDTTNNKENRKVTRLKRKIDELTAQKVTLVSL